MRYEMPGKALGCKPDRRKGKRCGALGVLAFMQRFICAVLLILAAFSCSSEKTLNGRVGTGEKKTLRISFERSGGFAGITIKTTVDEKDLAPDEAQTIRQLVEEADVFNLPRKIVPRSPRSDRFQYELSLEESGRKHTVTMSEEVLPEKLRPLIEWLVEKSRQTKKGKKSP